MDWIENKLKSTLYRLDCPSELELGEYDMGLLDDSLRGDEIAVHMSLCPHCVADLAQIQQYMALPLVDDQLAKSTAEKQMSFLEKVRVIIIDLLSPSADLYLHSPFQPALRGVQEDMATRVFQVDSYVIALSAVKNRTSWQKQQIIGDISPVLI